MKLNSFKNHLLVALSINIAISNTAFCAQSPDIFSRAQQTISSATQTLSFISNLAKTAVVSWWHIQEPQEIVIENKSAETLAQLFNAQENSQNFLLGASTAEHQSSHKCSAKNCSYSRFAQEQNLLKPIPEHGYCMDWWNNYEQYIDYAKKELGLNALRFSIGWALVQPNGPKTWNATALNHYADVFKYMIKQQMTPVVCFHHYTDPCWFIDKGGFEEERNLTYFKKFCARIYTHIMQSVAHDADALQALKDLKNRPPLWATYNSPEGYAFKVYHLGELPQAHNRSADNKTLKKGISWACHVINNMMKAHVLVYDALHTAHKTFASCGVDKPMVGFLKNIHQLDPANKTAEQKKDAWKSRIVCGIGNEIQNEGIYSFFEKQASKKLDFIGLNYYSNSYMHGSTKVQETDPKFTTNNKNYRIYPQGLYRALVEINQRMAQPLNIPIYVTENGIGIADTQTQWKKRNRFYQQYLYALYAALNDGIDIRGYLTWTLANNYEWQKPGQLPATAGDKRIYGLCKVINDGNHIELKDPNNYYITFVKALKNYPK